MHSNVGGGHRKVVQIIWISSSFLRKRTLVLGAGGGRMDRGFLGGEQTGKGIKFEM